MKFLSSILILAFCSPLIHVCLGQAWEYYEIDTGVKPSLELDAQGIPHISYMLEAGDGFVRHAIWNADQLAFQIETVSTGYFYGPLDVALDSEDQPHINYHSHSQEDQIHAYKSNGNWILDRIEDVGHDGWDNAIVLDSADRVHTSSIDPVSFGGVGLEYAYNEGSSWHVEAVGSGDLMYANATSLAIDILERPHISYHNDVTQDLMHAVKRNGIWVITAVDTEGNTGLFSSLVINAANFPMISYYQHLGDDRGVVKLASLQNSGWVINTVDTLHNVQISFSGARNLTSLALDSKGNPHIGYSDASVIKHAWRQGDVWQTQTVLDVSGTNNTLGQLTSLKLDKADHPHIAYYEISSDEPLVGIIKYARSLTSTDSETEAMPKESLELYPNSPNPFRDYTTIRYSLARPSMVSVNVYDLLGRQRVTQPQGYQQAGTYTLTLSSLHLPSGTYLYQLQTDQSVKSRVMILTR